MAIASHCLQRPQLAKAFVSGFPEPGARSRIQRFFQLSFQHPHPSSFTYLGTSSGLTPAPARDFAGLTQQCRRESSTRSSNVVAHSSSDRSAAAPHQSAGGSNKPVEVHRREGATSILNLPTCLTLARVVAVPVLVAAFYSSQPWATPVMRSSLFVVASLTDWLDGYLARKMKTTSAFGAFLDPVADKLMVAAALVLLCSRPETVNVGPAWMLPVPAIAIIGREITMSALREWAASQDGAVHQAVAVNNYGKWKTASQMLALTILLGVSENSPPYLALLGFSLLYVAAALALVSLGIYFKGIWFAFTRT